MTIMTTNDELFGNLDSKVEFLTDQNKTNLDGIYRIDLSKSKDRSKGYRAVLRFLPNFKKDGTVGQSAIEKVTHYVDIKNPKELAGYYDSPRNFGEKCALTDLYYLMHNSKNAILQEKSKMLKYSKKYYSFVLILEDENRPELVGKIMIFQYGKTIKDKISAEKSGEVTGVSTNIFNLQNGKDFILLVKEIKTGDETYPDYKMSTFKSETTPISLYFKDKKTFKPVPIKDGLIEEKAQDMVKSFLLDREHDLEEFSAKKLDDAQQARITEICNLLTGKASESFKSSETNKPTSDDFDFEKQETAAGISSGTPITEDDFFK